MTKLVYNDNNTEGHHPTSFDFIDTEIRKDDKIVATDLTDLYDVELTNLQNGEILVYDSAKEKWVNGEASAGCDVITADTIITIGYLGTFQDLKECFDWLRNNCKKISENATLTISILENQYIYDTISLNHPYGHRIVINSVTDISNYVYTDLLDYHDIEKPDNIDCAFLSSGIYHTIVIKSDGTLWATGLNDSGQLGLGDDGNGTNRNVFTQVGTENDWKYVACGNEHSIAIKTDGSMWATGRNTEGQLGLGDNNNRNVFTRVGSDNDWKKVGCGRGHSVALKASGTLWGCGWNYYGQLGSGDNIDSNVFIQESSNNTNWSYIECGHLDHTVALKTDGTLWGCGYNSWRQLGLGSDTTSKNIFTQEISYGTDWKDVSCGRDNTLAIKDNGTLWGTGRNQHGELGLGDNTYRTHYTQESGMDTDWDQLSSGEYHTMAIKTDGTLWGTGQTTYGQLGLNISGSYDIYVFTQEARLDTDWEQIKCGRSHSISIKDSLNLWGTGVNYYGQLGIGDYTTRIIFDQLTHIERLICREQLKNQKSGIFLSDNHSIKEMYMLNISLIYRWGNENINCNESNMFDIYYPLSIMNNSNTNLVHVSSDTILIKNNSYISIDTQEDITCHIYDNSVAEIKEPRNQEHIVKNRSTILTDNITKFDNSTFINSKLIEKK